MISMKRIRVLAASALLGASVILGSVAAFAATGTITASNVNVRADASTSASIVGTANTGESFTVGDSKVDGEGKTWYQITLASGNIGYVRSDFISVAEDPVPTYTPEEAPAEPAPTEPATTEPAPSSTGDYQLVMAADENGNDTLYLYNNAAGERMKLSDIEGLQTQLTTAQKEAKNAGNKYKVAMVVLIILLALAVAGCVLLFLRLRDALTNSRRERDLTSERRSQRRADASADSVSGLRRGTEPQRRSGAPQAQQARRNDAYASGARRANENGAPAARPAARPAQGAAPAGAPARMNGQGPDPYNRVRTQDRPQAARPAEGARPAQPAARPSQGGAPAQPATRRPQPKNFAEDDGFDYDFIKLDDKK